MEHSVIIRCMVICILFSAMMILPAYATDVTVGFLAGSNQLGEVEEAAYEWVEDTFQTKMLIADKSGNFKTNNGSAMKLDQFAVLWLFYTETNTLPDPFLEDATKKELLDYLEAGGSIFLSALGLKYVIDLEVDEGNVRVFQPLGKGPPEIGVMATDDHKDHPVFEGFDTGDPIFLTSMDQAGFTADFIDFTASPPAGKILGTKTRGGGAGAGERPLVEYDVDDGKIITLGHHNGVYTDTNSKEGENLRKLSENVLNYLGETSVFFDVEPDGKLATTWGNLKSALR